MPGTAAAPLPLAALGLDGEISRLDGALLVFWFPIALAGLVRSGRHLLEADEVERRRHPYAWPIGGRAVLTAAGELLAERSRGAVEKIGISQTLLGNTVTAASVEAEEIARVEAEEIAPRRSGPGDLVLGSIAGTIVHFAAFNPGVSAPSSNCSHSTLLPATYTSPSHLAQHSSFAPRCAYSAG